MSSPKSPHRPVPSPFTFERVADRRAEPRMSAEVLGLDTDARLTVGVHVRVVNVSRGGALLEQGEWLRPGTKTALRLTRPGEGDRHQELLAAPGVAARCWVHRLSPLCYRTALVFNGGQADAPTSLGGPDSGEVDIQFTDEPA